MQEYWITWMVWGEMLFLAAIVGIIAHYMQVKNRARTDLHLRTLEKFTTATELSDFLHTEAGRRFFESFSMGKRTVFRRILGAVQVGTVLFVLGLAFLLLAALFDDLSGGFTIAGVLVLALGLGLLLSAGISYALAKSWKLLEGPAGGGGELASGA